MDANNSPALTQQGPFWTRDKENRLIGLYSHFTLLWDCRHPHYYKRDRRDQAMRAIAATFNNEFDVLSLKKKIWSLRNYFVKELKKEHLAAQSSPPERYVSRWEHFDALHFLRRVLYSIPLNTRTIYVPQAEVKIEPLDASRVFATEPGHDTAVLPLVPDFQSPATPGKASVLQPLPSQGVAQQAETVEEPCVTESAPPSDLADATATLSPFAKRLRRSSQEERSPPVQVDDKPNLAPSSSSAQSGHSSVTSEPYSNGVLGSAVDSRGSASTDKNVSLSLFCGQVILEMRTMTNVQRDYAKLCLMQILFDVKYKT